MIRVFALLVVAATWLAGAGPRERPGPDFRDFFGGGSNFGWAAQARFPAPS